MTNVDRALALPLSTHTPADASAALRGEELEEQAGAGEEAGGGGGCGGEGVAGGGGLVCWLATVAVEAGDAASACALACLETLASSSPPSATAAWERGGGGAGGGQVTLWEEGGRGGGKTRGRVCGGLVAGGGGRVGVGGVGVEAEAALLYAVLGHAALSVRHRLWHSVHLSILRLAASRSLSARRSHCLFRRTPRPPLRISRPLLTRKKRVQGVRGCGGEGPHEHTPSRNLRIYPTIGPPPPPPSTGLTCVSCTFDVYSRVCMSQGTGKNTVHISRLTHS